jgi:hypothetical protein
MSIIAIFLQKIPISGCTIVEQHLFQLHISNTE